MEDVELVIVGGGSAGLGAAMAAVGAGIKPLLIEAQAAVSLGVSANSLRIIHGGFRYLQNLNFARVRRSAQAQRELRQMFPQAFIELPCLMPLESWGFRSRFPVQCAHWLYRRIAGKAALPGYVLSSAQAISEEPVLDGLVPYGALCWTDLLMSDPAQVANNCTSSIIDGGGEVLLQTRVAEILPCDSGFRLSLIGRGGDRRTLRARRVVEALGPGFGTIRGSPAASLREEISWIRAFNLVVPGDWIKRHGVAIHHGGRLFFAVPRGIGAIAIGTGYLPWQEGQAPSITESEQRDFMALIAAAFRRPELAGADILGVDCGIIPSKQGVYDNLKPLGTERIFDFGAYVVILSTKYTTFLPQGKRAIEQVSKNFGG